MKHLKMAGVGIIGVMAMTVSAHAQIDSQENVNFGINIEEACSITIDNHGEFGVSGDQKTLDSTLAGGTTAQAQITANTLGVEMWVDSPNNFALSPADAELGTTFSTSYNFDGILGLPTGTRDGDTRTSMLLGTANMNIDAKAERAEEPFEAGDYQYVAILKCVSS